MQLSDISLNQVVLIVIVIFLLLQLRQRKFRFWRSMIVPTIMLMVTLLFVRIELQGPFFNTMVLLAGFILGIFMGMIIARFTKLKIGKDGSLLMRGSFIAMSIWFSIIIAKLYGQNMLNQWGLSSNLVLALFLIIRVSTMISERMFIYYRYLRNRKKWKKIK